MGKLKLNLDEIKVKSFSISTNTSNVGTVVANQTPPYTNLTGCADTYICCQISVPVTNCCEWSRAC